MNMVPSKKELIAQAEASEAALRDIWKAMSNRFSAPDLHRLDRAGDVAVGLSNAATSAAETAVVKMKANPYATGLIGAGALLLLFGATRTKAPQKTAGAVQSHPIASTAASLALGAGIAALMPQNRSRLLALLPAAGVVIDQIRRWAMPEAPEPEATPAKPRSKRATPKASPKAAASTKPATKPAAKRARKPAAPKSARKAEVASDAPRANGAPVN